MRLRHHQHQGRAQAVPAAQIHRQPVPDEAEVFTEDGESIGGLILFARDGYLSCLEIYNWGDPVPLPRLDQISPFVATDGSASLIDAAVEARPTSGLA